MPNPSSGPISVNQINDSGTSQADMGSLVPQVIGGNSAAGQQIPMSQYYFTFNNTLQASVQQNIGASGTSFSPDGQGASVAISSDGTTAVVTNGKLAAAGSGGDIKTMVYVRSGSSWSLQQMLSTAYTGTTYFDYRGGAAISANGNTLAFGSIGDNSGIGAVWVYTRSGTTWSLQQKIVPTPYRAGGQRLGSTVALSASGNTLAISSGLDENPTGGSTPAYVWTRSGSTWTQQAQIAGPEKLESSVALSADGATLVVGAPYDVNIFGRSFIYIFSGGTWNLQTTITPPIIGSPATFGTSVSLSADGNTCAIGAPTTMVSDIFYVGAVYVYKRSGTTWTAELTTFTASDWLPISVPKGGDQGPRFGTSVSLSGDGSYLAVGGSDQPKVSGSPFTFGAYWTLSRSGSTWAQVGLCKYSTSTQNEGQFGWSLAMSSNNNYLVIGEPTNQANPPNLGRVYIYG
jgi:hypothetical protein